MLRKAACASLFFVGLAVAAYAADVRISRLNTWELTFSSNPPRVISLLDGTTNTAFTYVCYEVKNETSQEIDFYPALQIESENGCVTTAGVYPRAEAEISKRCGMDVLGFSKIIGTIKPGETKKGIAVFKGVDPTAKKLSLYVSGLSGDFKVDQAKEGGLVVMYRTFKATYYRPGDEWHLEIDPVTLESSEWVWRE
jgi:hypothetical protein